MTRFGNSNRFTVGLFLLVIHLITPSTTHADNFVVGTQDIAYLPYYNFPSTHDKGVGWAILEAFAKENGHTFDYVVMPVNRLQIELNKGNLDFVFPDNQRWNKHIDSVMGKIYSNALINSFAVTLVKTENINRPLSHIKRLAIPQGFTPAKWTDLIASKQVEVNEVENVYQGLRYLQSDTVDAMDVEYNVAKRYEERFAQLGPFTADLTLPHNSVAFCLSSLKHLALIEEFNTFLGTHKALIEKIKQQYHIASTQDVIEETKRMQKIDNEHIWRSQ